MDKGYATGVVLILLVVLINGVASLIAKVISREVEDNGAD